MNKHYIIESHFEYKELKCVVTFSDLGSRCGYVGVSKKSPLFGIDYHSDLKKPELLKELKQTEIGKRGIIACFCWDGKKTSPEMLFNVHGGLTYSGKGVYPVTTREQTWWFGFDCAHLNDKKDISLATKLFPDFNPGAISMFDSGVIRTKDYVEQECRNLAEQILCVESIY